MTDNFWKNISRYPSFFISSIIGLILIILKPINNLFKNSKQKVILFGIVIIFVIIIYLTIRNMSNI